MKYGVPLDKDNNLLMEQAREFKDDHWFRLQKIKNTPWRPYPIRKVFISFCELDRRKMSNLKRALKVSELLIPVVIEDRKEGARDLSELIINGIIESKYFIPILSENSMISQWVNQEIGYAKSLKPRLEIIPIVESSIIDRLKGFIHKNIQLSYQFQITGNERKDRKSYREAYKAVIAYMENEVLKNIQRTKK